ncbi:putative 3-oxoadipate enol-lactonase [Bradyrhizobium oligotrophicum S58]|uniref:Putative 3-oxoadipate enol-lactonase n=1 Tax=Bradyrhizobium oligotrophicum S58 TaxID=1245469 RepID=M4ZBZ0_9BRAD|nr:alpha/beta hydrolase [Bradyrhizobium oligotrophicum]BAM91257.1 putative 3-oxoadipate enol-lactonase [Bradyrhizobium oligotrophicum S58]
MPASQILTTTDGRFGYEAAGEPRRQTIVFLHGIGGAALAWRGQLEHFGEHYHAVAWDMPGYGRSARLDSISITTLADALQDFLIQIDAHAPIVVGHSIGGMIVQEWLMTHRQSAAAVVLAQTSPAFGKSDGDWQKSFIEARLGPLDRGATMASLAPDLVRELVGDDPDPAGLALATACMAGVPEASYRASMLALLGFDRRQALKEIKVPTLVLSGSKDRNAPAPMMEKMASFIPGADYVELQGAGHLVNLERPEEFNAALAFFLKTHATTAAVEAS